VNILYIVNGISKTSIPWRWYEFFNKNSKGSNIEILPIKKLFKSMDLIKRADIAHGHHIKAMAIFLLFNLFFRKKSIYTVHGSYIFLSKTNALLLYFIFKYSDRVVFVNRRLYSVLPDRYKSIIKNRYEIILNGVELKYRYRKIDIYKKFNIKIDDTICFHPARFVKEKNHLNLIRAVEPILNSNPNIKLYLAGDGKLRGEIISLIEELKLQKSVILLGLIDRDDVYNFLENCEIFLMPSISEGLNISFLEAISMQCKIVVSDIEQFTYPLRHYNLDTKRLNITLVDPFNIDSIRDGIEKSLKAKKRVDYDSKEFSLQTMINRYKQIYKLLIDRF